MNFLKVFLIVIFGLAGCQAAPDRIPAVVESRVPVVSDSGPTQPSSTSQALSPTAAATRPAPGGLGAKAEDLRGIRIQFWYAGSGDLQKEYEAQIAEFNRANVWGINVVGRSFSAFTNLEDQVLMIPKGGELPQAVTAPLEMLLTWQGQSQLLVSLDPYTYDPEWGLTAPEISDFEPVFWQSEQVGGKLWGIPAGQNVQVLFYNQSWAEELGFRQPPASTADFRTQACAAVKSNLKDADPENDGTGGWIVATDPLALESWRRALGGEPLPGQADMTYTFDTPNSVKAFTFLRKLLDENCAWNARNPAPYPYFAQRRALFFSGSLTDLPLQQHAMELQKSNDRWTILAYPSEKGPASVLVSGVSHAILQSNPAQQLAAWIFLRSLIIPRVQARLAVAGSLLPPRTSALAELEAYRQSHSQWAQAAGWKGLLQPAPYLASWRTARRMLQDAVWQIMQPFTKLDGIPAILAELDRMVKGTLK